MPSSAQAPKARLLAGSPAAARCAASASSPPLAAAYAPRPSLPHSPEAEEVCRKKSSVQSRLSRCSQQAPEYLPRSAASKAAVSASASGASGSVPGRVDHARDRRQVRDRQRGGQFGVLVAVGGPVVRRDPGGGQLGEPGAGGPGQRVGGGAADQHQVAGPAPDQVGGQRPADAARSAGDQVGALRTDRQLRLPVGGHRAQPGAERGAVADREQVLDGRADLGRGGGGQLQRGAGVGGGGSGRQVDHPAPASAELQAEHRQQAVQQAVVAGRDRVRSGDLAHPG